MSQLIQSNWNFITILYFVVYLTNKIWVNFQVGLLICYRIFYFFAAPQHESNVALYSPSSCKRALKAQWLQTVSNSKNRRKISCLSL